MLEPTPASICILRLSALGDVCHVIPVVRLLQKYYPNTEITWVCGKFEYKFLQFFKKINFIVFDKKAGSKEYFKLWRQLRHKHFDVLLHMQVSARANIASLSIRAKLKLGWDRARSRDLHHLFIKQHIPAVSQQHQVLGFLEFARALGIPKHEPVWDIPISDSAELFVSQAIDLAKPYIVISACSSHALRNWQAKKYARLADYAIENYQLQVVLSGGPSSLEIEMADQIQSFMLHRAINLVAKDTLEQLLALLNAADALVSPDSGPAHIANALGVPVIGLYACTWSKRSGPYNSLNYCVDKFELAAETFLNCSAQSLKWGTKIEKPGVMDLIQVDEVCQKLDLIMSDKSKLINKKITL